MNIFQCLLKKRLSLFIFAITISLISSSHAMKSIDPDGKWKEFFDATPYIEKISDKKISKAILNHKHAHDCEFKLHSCGSFFLLVYQYGEDKKLEYLYEKNKKRLFAWNINDKNPKIDVDLRFNEPEYYQEYGLGTEPHDYVGSESEDESEKSLEDVDFMHSYAVSPKGKFLAVWNSKKNWCIYSLPSYVLIKAIPEEDGIFTFLDDSFCLIESEKKDCDVCRIFSLENNRCKPVKMTNNKVVSNYFSQKNNIADIDIEDNKNVIFSSDKTMHVIINKEKKLLEIFKKNNKLGAIPFSSEFIPKDVTFSTNGDFLGIKFENKILWIWNTKNMTLSTIVENVYSYHFEPDSTIMYVNFDEKKSYGISHKWYKYEASTISDWLFNN